jgi:hypothetical protein
MYALEFKGSFSIVASSSLSLIILGMSAVIVLSLWIVLRKNRANGTLGKPVFLERYGTLTTGLRVTRTIGTYWNIIILVRWQITAAIIILLSNFPAFQIQFLIGISLLNQCLIIHGQPMESKVDNIVAFLNEFLIS